MSSQMTAEDTRRLSASLSVERLNKLIAITRDETIAVSSHQDTLGLNSHLMKIVATVEIALRNNIYNNIANYFGVANWLQQPPIALTLVDGDRKKIVSALDSAKRSEYAKKSQAEKAVLKASVFPNGKPPDIKPFKFVQKKRENIPVSDGKVIAELTFAFWKRLYSSEYEYQLWRPTLKRTFPNKNLKRSHVSAQLEVVYQMRNRLAHHEPVFGDRFRKLISAIKFVLLELDSKGQTMPRALEKLLAADIEDAVELHTKMEAVLTQYRSKSP